jgi:DNA-binding HxlR family transcriptional regulator
MTPFRELDPLLHSQLRLAIMSLLISVEEADFSYLKDKTEATAGNLSTQITKLKEGGYIEVRKKFRENYPQTSCRITSLGRKKFAEYVAALNEYLKPN